MSETTRMQGTPEPGRELGKCPSFLPPLSLPLSLPAIRHIQRGSMSWAVWSLQLWGVEGERRLTLHLFWGWGKAGSCGAGQPGHICINISTQRGHFYSHSCYK
jgi:hypothetical protein